MLDAKTKTEVKKQLDSLSGKVTLIVFTQENECQFCADNRKMAEEVAGLSGNISLEVYDFQKDKAKADEYKIDKIPAIAVIGEKDYGIRFYGLPYGYEFASFLEAIKLAASGNPGLSNATKKYLDTLSKDVHIQVFVTPTCPYCPMAVILAHKLAGYSDKVRADMVEISEFPHLAVKYNVQGVPVTVINETISQVGAAPEPLLLNKIKEALG
ncbi:MAG: thioredoxin family protein [Spirochaetales bacterium]|nr:thioredoxin family protein [Spirochaetales bacterium]